MQDKIQEIMGLVDSLVTSVNEAHLAKREDWRDACFQSADNLIETIQSKLRELVRECDQAIQDLHFVVGITNTSGDA